MTAIVWVCFAILLSVAGFGAAFTYLWRLMRLSGSEYDRRLEELQNRLTAMSEELRDCRRRLTECEQRYSPVAESALVPASLHLNRRGQVARLFKRGQDPRSIASTLGMSQGEVKLIIKMLDLGAAPESCPGKENLNRKTALIFDTASGVLAGEA